MSELKLRPPKDKEPAGSRRFNASPFRSAGILPALFLQGHDKSCPLSPGRGLTLSSSLSCHSFTPSFEGPLASSRSQLSYHMNTRNRPVYNKALSDETAHDA